MAMEYEGKIYRNLQEQVGYLTWVAEQLNQRIEEVRAQIPSKMIVEELPETGDPLITYYVGPKGTAPNQYYEVWVWVQEEENGPFVWRELEDTDQVDLSGYLEKQTDVTTYQKVYGKTAAGGQTMITATYSSFGGTIPQRNSAGQIEVPETPSEDSHAASKKYVDGFVKKDTSITTSRMAYLKSADGSTTEMCSVTGAAQVGAIPLYVGQGQLNTASPTNDSQAVNRGYANETYVAKQSGSTSYRQVYAKGTDGTQYMQVVNGKDMDAGVDRLACYGTDGRLRVGTPVNDKDATTKKYVDDAVGQLLYLHEIQLVYTIDASNTLGITCYLVNEDSTPIDSLTRPIFKRLDVSYGALNPNLNSASACAITKMADGFRQDDYIDPYPGFLYQYYSGSTLTNGNTFGLTPTVTDVVINF